METCDFSLFCRVHMKDTAPKEMGSNKQRKGDFENALSRIEIFLL